MRRALAQPRKRLLVERGFVRGEMIREINLPAFRPLSVDHREPPAQDVRVGPAAGIGRGDVLFRLPFGEDGRRPCGLAQKGEADVFREGNGRSDGHEA